MEVRRSGGEYDRAAEQDAPDVCSRTCSEPLDMLSNMFREDMYNTADVRGIAPGACSITWTGPLGTLNNMVHEDVYNTTRPVRTTA